VRHAGGRLRPAAGATEGDAWEGTGGGEGCGGDHLEIKDGWGGSGGEGIGREGEKRCGKLKLEVTLG